ncbi:MAG: HD domain-containing protein [Alloprevotella sp.]|nr:HD domain-containing protein [Alloprevotella sp.]
MENNLTRIRQSLREYVERSIVPQYAEFDAAHREDHARAVMERSVALAESVGADVEMAYAVAAYHDLGLRFGREQHHKHSARLLLADRRLREWFTEEQLAKMAEACEDHRASLEHEPRSIYGRIVAEADRLIVPETVVRRTVQYGLAHYPELSRERHYERMVAHLHEKYDYGGYLRLWIPDSPNAAGLEELRQLIHDPQRLRTLFDSFYGGVDTDGLSPGRVQRT